MNRAGASLAGVLVVAALVGSCGGSGADDAALGDGSVVETESTTPEDGPPDTVPNLTGPLTIELEDNTETVVVGPDGGTVEVIGADGSVYSLVIPESALAGDVEITATPVAELGNVGFETHSVVFGPEGTTFFEPSELTITPAEELPPVDRQIVFAFSDDGTQFGLAQPVIDSEEIVILVPHFSGYGFGNVTEAGQVAFIERQASDAAARISSEFGELLMMERQAQLLGGETDTDLATVFDTAMSQYETEVVKPLLQVAGSSCAAAKRAISVVLGVARQRQLLGAGEGTGMDNLATLFSQAYPVCEAEAIAQCQEAEDPVILVQFWLGSLRQQQLLGFTDPLIDVDSDKAVEICSPSYAYQIVGGLDDFQTDTAVCDVRQPFALSGGGIDMQLSGGLTGTYTYTGIYDASGSGEYAISLPDGPGQPGTMIGGGPGTISGAAGSGTERYTLTPITC